MEQSNQIRIGNNVYCSIENGEIRLTEIVEGIEYNHIYFGPNELLAFLFYVQEVMDIHLSWTPRNVKKPELHLQK